MVKKIFCLGMIFCIVFNTSYVRVEAKTDMEQTESGVQEMLTDYEAEMKKVDEEFRNLEISLPQEEYEWKESDVINCDNISKQTELGTKATVKVYYSEGEKTSTTCIKPMTDAINFEMQTQYMSSGSSYTYSFGSNIKSSFNMPGMIKTNVKGIMCKDMVPQGITYHDGYFFITAYCGNSEHYSVIYVLKGTTKSLVATLVLEGMPHAGGIAYANGYLWIGATSKVWYYKYSDVKEIINGVENNSEYTCGYLITCERGKLDVPDGGEASFITTYSGYLCLGSYQTLYQKKGKLMFCVPDVDVADDKLECEKSIELPKYAQGAEFYVYNNNVYMIITTSCGNADSGIYVYSGSKVESLTLKKIHNLPCMLEETVTVGGYTYFVFESCSNEYNDSATPVIGKVCGMTTAFVYK